MAETIRIGYPDERNIQILIALMKHHGVRRGVVSPGATNVTLVAPLQEDPDFELYSSVDERSAAYMACGMAAETSEPVFLSCTGATASRNYLPALTEAYYRKLPVLAITSSQHLGRIGHMVPQVIDRTSSLGDVCRLSVQCPAVSSSDDEWACAMAIHRALLELGHHGGGPVHVNLVTTYSENFSVKMLPPAPIVDRIVPGDELPSLDGRRVAVFVGAHSAWDGRLTAAVDAFCDAYGAVVICDQTSNYRGKHRALASLAFSQDGYIAPTREIDTLVHIGEVSGAYYRFLSKQTWRVSPDGEVRDALGGLRYVFEMGEAAFFEAYAALTHETVKTDSMTEWRGTDTRLRSKIPELPFSNIWMAQQTAHRLPEGSVLHLGILNSLRSWNFFETPESVEVFCNTGGFGIDGCMSTLLGAALASPDKVFFCVLGDLAGFYDLNSLGNRHLPANVRIMLVNNGVGTEFKNYNHMAGQFGTDADAFIAARGHFGSGSHRLLKHYTQDLGFDYLSASTKEEFTACAERFFTSERLEHPMFLEVFTDSDDESAALRTMSQLEVSTSLAAKEKVAQILGERGVKVVKKVLGR